MRCIVFSKLCYPLLVISFWINTYSIACFQDNGLKILSLKNQDITVYLGLNCLREFLNCLRTDNVKCEAMLSFSTQNQAFVDGIDISYQYTTSGTLKACFIEITYDIVISCSSSYTSVNNKETVLMLRENKADCYRTGFVPLNEWSILEIDYVIQYDYNDYISGVCIENVLQTSLQTALQDHTTETTFATQVYSSISTTEQTTIRPTVDILSNNFSVIIPNHDNNQDNQDKKDKKTLIISLCVVFSMLILIGVLIGLFILNRKRTKRMKPHKVSKGSELDSIATSSTIIPHKSNNNDKIDNIVSKGYTNNDNPLVNINESNIQNGKMSIEDINKDDINYETYNTVSINPRRQNDIILTDGDGYLAPSRDMINKVAFQNTAYTGESENVNDFTNTTYEDLDSININDFSGKTYTHSSDSVYDEYDTDTMLTRPEANTSYQNTSLDQRMLPIDSDNPNNKAENENVSGNEIQGIVLEELGDMGDSRDYENLETINLDLCNHITGEALIDETLNTNTEIKNMYFILEETQ